MAVDFSWLAVVLGTRNNDGFERLVMEEFGEFFSGIIETIFGLVYDEVVGAGVVDFGTTEGFFEFGEAVPRVGFVRTVWSNTPKIKAFNSLLFGVKNGFCEKGDGGGEFFVIGVGGGLHIISGVCVIEEEAGGDDLAVCREGGG